MTVRLRTLAGAALEAALDDLAALRIRVFRDWPYLYDGDLDYERRYMASYRKTEGAILVGAYADDRLIGAATGTKLEDHAGDFGAAFSQQNLPLDDVFYCAESVLLPEFRGQGVGHAFFDARERHAHALGRQHVAFCSVVRPLDHPMRPAEYRPLDPFWEKRGYRPVPSLVAQFSWKDVDQAQETEKSLQFWMRAI